jgi:SAM-dependent methyltransferase
MRSFDLDETFDLAVVAVRSFGYLLDRQEQASALGCISRHLRPGGVLAVDLLHADPAWLLQPPGTLNQDLFTTRDDGSMVSRTETVVSTDLASQVRVTRSAYELIAPGGLVTKRVVQWPARYTYRFEAEHLLERAGFAVEAVHGGYRREPFASGSKVMLMIARRR